MKLLKKHLGIIIFCVIYIAFSFATYKSYGITGDEQSAYDLGKEYITYFSRPSSYMNTIAPLIGKSDDQLKDVPLFSQYFRLYPTILSLFNPSGYYEWYHLLNLLFSTSLFVLMYVAGYLVYRKQAYALIFPLLVLLTPRLFGDFPANPKDIPFAVFYFASLTAIYLFRNVRSASNLRLVKILVLGILFGLTQSQRIVGLTIYPLFLAFSFLEASRTASGFRSLLKNFFVSILLECVLIGSVGFLLMLATWPLMGINVFQNLTVTLLGTQKYQAWDNTMLYLGQNITKDQRPWHYLFVWFGVTLPLATTALFFFSLAKIKSWLRNSFLTLLTGALLLNILFYLIINPVVYNGIRHFLYLVPIIILIGGNGLVLIIKSSHRTVRNIVLATILIYYTLVVLHTVRLFPHQYVYFNEIVGNTKGAPATFETDYWGTAYKEASEWAINYKNSNSIGNMKVYACNVSYAVQYYAKGQFDVVNSSKEADLILCDIERDLLNKYPYPIIHSITFDNAVLINIRHNDISQIKPK